VPREREKREVGRGCIDLKMEHFGAVFNGRNKDAIASSFCLTMAKHMHYDVTLTIKQAFINALLCYRHL